MLIFLSFNVFLHFFPEFKTIFELCGFVKFIGAFRLYDVDNDGFITRDEMYNIVDAIYQMVVSKTLWGWLANYYLASLL